MSQVNNMNHTVVSMNDNEATNHLSTRRPNISNAPERQYGGFADASELSPNTGESDTTLVEENQYGGSVDASESSPNTGENDTTLVEEKQIDSINDKVKKMADGTKENADELNNRTTHLFLKTMETSDRMKTTQEAMEEVRSIAEEAGKDTVDLKKKQKRKAMKKKIIFILLIILLCALILSIVLPLTINK
ncbi:hypothetical protein H4219_001366 [Mycoemilia scoparia]|uniref:Uncharacterized protein n=1 Tax=Mycoemilia scoparia TaxID=417184 RepID=A0A9W8A661_9FUNG|nr:hypothetical protein H4219_001366 [Mycoemilia scoparia]